MNSIERFSLVADWLESLGVDIGGCRTVNLQEHSIWFHGTESRELLSALARRIELPRLSDNGGGKDPNLQGYIHLGGQEFWVVAYYKPGLLGAAKVVEVMVEENSDISCLLAESAEAVPALDLSAAEGCDG